MAINNKNLLFMTINNKNLLLACITSLVFLAQPAVSGEAKYKLDKIGVQLYSLRTEAEKSLERVLKEVSDMGYEQVELHTLYGMQASELRKLLDKYNLQTPSTHRGFNEIAEDVEGTIRDAKALGLELVIVPWLDIKEYNSKEKWLAFAKEMNKLGKTLKERGIQLAYHNHDFEFNKLEDGSVPYDVLIANTNPDYVALQMDLFWITKAGKDPIRYMKENSGRIVSVHIKDMTSSRKMTEVGYGKIDFAKIFKAGKKHGLKYFIVEHDEPEEPLASVKQSIQYLQTLRY